MSAASDERRDRAVWLAELATWRRGLLGALVGACGDMDAVLALEPHAVAAAARARARRRGARITRGEGGGAPEGADLGRGRGRAGAVGDRTDEEDASLFAALLARGPVVGAAARPDVVDRKSVV